MDERVTFLDEPERSEVQERFYDADVESDGYVGNLTHLWCWRADVYERFIELRGLVTSVSTLTTREVAVLVTATAAERGDSYCSLAWGARLASLSDESTAADLIAGKDDAGALSQRERLLGEWARQVVRDPNVTTAADVEQLRLAGLSDREIFEATAFVALRLAFSTVNDALGAAPDGELAAEVPEQVRAAVTFGRPPA